MQKKLIIFFLLVTTLTFGNNLDGYYWMEMTEEQRLNYLYGAVNENYILLNKLIYDGLLNEVDITVYQILGETYEDVVKEVTAFYEVTKEYSLSISLVIHIRNTWKFTEPEGTI